VSDSLPRFSLPEEIRAPLEKLAVPEHYAAGSFLFKCGDPVRGVYLVRSGQVALSLPHTPEPPRMAGPGSALGIPASVCSRPYSLTAENREAVEVGFIAAAKFVAVLKQYPVICLAVIETLASELNETRRQASAMLEQFTGLD
jgi:CRP-like cAMP-binding protein